MKKLVEFTKKLWRDDDGQGMVEYVLIIAFIALVAVITLETLGKSIADKYSDVANKLTGQTTQN